MLGGNIWFESVIEKGSVFYFTIPYMPEIREPDEIVENKKGIQGSLPNRLKILIAEDDLASDMLLTAILKESHREILHAKTGIEAVETCRNIPDIDLVLMDIKMPEMDGFEAIRQIRQFNKDVVIIAQTAFAQVGDKNKSIEAGCNDYIAKPIRKDELSALIKKHLNS
jgi:CheY-like chemotaxis protein